MGDIAIAREIRNEENKLKDLHTYVTSANGMLLILVGIKSQGATQNNNSLVMTIFLTIVIIYTIALVKAHLRNNDDGDQSMFLVLAAVAGELLLLVLVDSSLLVWLSIHSAVFLFIEAPRSRLFGLARHFFVRLYDSVLGAWRGRFKQALSTAISFVATAITNKTMDDDGLDTAV